MAWKFSNNGEAYYGPTHTLADIVFSGATRTPNSRRLTFIAEAEVKKPGPKKAAKKTK
tara:strand:- start:415 stop:588 length:174 start_codon:yes stop_codon:yes gene_type:complete